MMPNVLMSNEVTENEIEFRPVSQIYKDFLSSIGIEGIDTSTLDNISDDNVVKNLNILIELIMENVSENSMKHMAIRNTARLFSCILNGEDAEEPGFEEVGEYNE